MMARLTVWIDLDGDRPSRTVDEWKGIPLTLENLYGNLFRDRDLRSASLLSGGVVLCNGERVGWWEKAHVTIGNDMEAPHP